MKEAKQIGSVTTGPAALDGAKLVGSVVGGPNPASALNCAKLVGAVVAISDVNLKCAKMVGAVVCEMQEGFVSVAFC